MLCVSISIVEECSAVHEPHIRRGETLNHEKIHCRHNVCVDATQPTLARSSGTWRTTAGIESRPDQDRVHPSEQPGASGDLRNGARAPRAGAVTRLPQAFAVAATAVAENRRLRRRRE